MDVPEGLEPQASGRAEASVAGLWRRLEDDLGRRAPAALTTLGPPAGIEEIRRAEAELGLAFPDDFVASLREHDGQLPLGDPWGPGPASFWLVPNSWSEDGESYATGGPLECVDHIRVLSRRYRRGLFPPDVMSTMEVEGPVRREGGHSWVVFLDPGCGDVLALDLEPAPGGHRGQVVAINHDPPALFVLAPSYHTWFRDLVERYESGRYSVTERDGLLVASDSRKFARRRDGSGR